MAITPRTQQVHLTEDPLDSVGCIGTAGLARIWSDVLGVPDVDADEDFFNLGGNSLQALQMLAEVSRLTNLAFGTRVLYESPTPAAFHARLHIDCAAA
jgi:hypothetical protein